MRKRDLNLRILTIEGKSVVIAGPFVVKILNDIALFFAFMMLRFWYVLVIVTIVLFVLLSLDDFLYKLHAL